MKPFCQSWKVSTAIRVSTSDDCILVRVEVGENIIETLESVVNTISDVSN